MKSTYNIYSIPFGVLLVFLFTLQTPASANDEIDLALAVERWQSNLLFNPTSRQLELESKGRVNIYDGLKDTEVAHALDSQFDRIQSMMFVRTVVTGNDGEPLIDPETGNTVLEDDDCD
jgi:hypothetical protein